MKVLTSAELAVMSESERAKAIAEFAGTGPGREMEPSSIELRIRAYEVRYATSSAELPGKLREGRMQADADIAMWVLLLSVRLRLER
jgi:hypothetical protein